MLPLLRTNILLALCIATDHFSLPDTCFLLVSSIPCHELQGVVTCHVELSIYESQQD